MEKTVRWQQRFQNLEKAFAQLEGAVKIKGPSIAERAGMIQLFEISFELAWKTLKDYLESQEFEVKGPRDTVKLAYQNDLIDNGDTWIKALEDRNLTTHTYDEETAKVVEKEIREKYFPTLENIIKVLRQKI